MKNTFLEYYQPDSSVVKKIWADAIFIFDTNVLLNLYRYSNNTADKFIQIISNSNINRRIWIPFQVGLEFNKNRLTVLNDQKKNYKDFEKKMYSLVHEVENKNRNPFFSEELTAKLMAIKKNFEDEVIRIENNYDDQMTCDPMLEKIISAFDNKVGTNFTINEIDKIQKEGEERYKNKIPPGYCDIKKVESERYGDLLIWKQILKKSKEDNIDVIFVLDDRKDDWWLIHTGKTISPRPELLKEFRVETEQDIHFYKPFQFLEYSKKYFNSDINVEIINEVKNYTDESDDFIQVNLSLQGDIENFNSFFNELKNTGYNISSEATDSNDIHHLDVILPNIPDLERRFESKYISNLSSYNMMLIARNTK